MFYKLAFRNVRRQFSSYAIYFITVMLTITMIFSVNNIIQSDIMSSMLVNYYSGTKAILIGITGFLALIMAFVLGYATNFLLKKRKKEFALYLVMGMTRKNIIGIFMLETAITFGLALGAGLLLGLVFYQALMGIFISYIELDYTLTGYSPVAFLYTIVTVCAVFLLSSAASAGYLKFEKISKLLNADKIAEKSVRFPVLWVIIAFAGILGTALFIDRFLAWLDTAFFQTFLLGGILVVMILLSVALGSMGLCKGITWLIVKAKSGRAKGTGMFTARQLSGSATSNSVMVALLSVLMSLVIVGPNVFFSVSSIYTERVEEWYIYDIHGSISILRYGEDVTVDQVEKIEEQLVAEYTEKIEKYVGIENYAVFNIYWERVENDWGGSHNTLIKYSDFQNICKVLNYDLPEELGQSFDCRCSDSVKDPFEWKYGILRCPNRILLNYEKEFKVVPDAETDGIVPTYGVLAVGVEDVKYDVRALEAELNPVDSYGNKEYNFKIKEYERLDELGGGGLFLLGDLYASAVFLLLTLGILSLKMLSMVSEDKPKYRIMWKLGAKRSQLFRSMLVQLLFFCCLPFLIPVFINFPLVSVIDKIYSGNGYEMPLLEIIGQLAGFTSVVLGVCILYLVAASIVAWQDIRRSLRESD